MKYKFTKTDSEKFRKNLIQIMDKKIRETVEIEGTEKLDEILCLRETKAPDMDTIVEELHEVLISACTSLFKILQTTKKALPPKSVPGGQKNLQS